MALKDFLRFGPPKDDADKPAAGKEKVTKQDRAQQAADGPQQHGWTAGANMATKATVGLLWLALIAGPVALGLRVLVPGGEQYIPTSGQTPEDLERAAVSEFASRAVVAWLETPKGEEGNAALAEFFGGIDQERPSYPWTAEHEAVADAVKLENGMWAVTIGVDVTDAVNPNPTRDETPDPDGTETDGADTVEPDPNETTPAPLTRRMYFQVPIVYVDGAMAAQALPSPVSEPATRAKMEMPYYTNVGNAHPVFESAQKFLEAMLVNADRAGLKVFTAPGTTFDIIDPPPYTVLEVTDVQATVDVGTDKVEPSDGEQVGILVTVRLTGTNEQVLNAQYAMSLVARQGRWEVAEMQASPALTANVPTSVPTIPQPQVIPDGDATGTDEPNPDPTGTDPTAPATDGTGTEPPADGTGTEPAADPQAPEGEQPTTP